MASQLPAPGIPRTVGIVFIALGFVCGMQGLDQPGSFWLPTALGLLVAGILAQGYAFYCQIRRVRSRQDSSH
jgi:hypothetical protein